MDEKSYKSEIKYKDYWLTEYCKFENIHGKVTCKNKPSLILRVMILIIGPIAILGICGAIAVDLQKVIYYRYSMWNIAMHAPIYICMFLFILTTCWDMVLEYFAKYNFSQQGIRRKLPLLKERYISWDEFQQICVCYDSYVTKGERAARIIICLVKKGAIKDSAGRWKERRTGKRMVIALGHTEELYEDIQRNCPFEVVDLRQTPAYRLNKWS